MTFLHAHGGRHTRRALNSQTPTSRCRSATAGHQARARGSPPAAGHAATGTHVARRPRPGPRSPWPRSRRWTTGNLSSHTCRPARLPSARLRSWPMRQSISPQRSCSQGARHVVGTLWPQQSPAGRSKRLRKSGLVAGPTASAVPRSPESGSAARLMTSFRLLRARIADSELQTVSCRRLNVTDEIPLARSCNPLQSFAVASVRSGQSSVASPDNRRVTPRGHPARGLIHGIASPEGSRPG
jgi:hypothetical protein